MDSTNPAMGVAGAVLAGGRGSRLGGNKAMLDLAGRPIVKWVGEAFAGAGFEWAVVAKEVGDLDGLGCEVVVESAFPRHPLLGVITALEWAEGRSVVVCACDLPFVTPELLRRLAGATGTVVPRVGGHHQPLIARYDQAAHPVLKAQLEAEASMAATIDRLGARVLEEDDLTGVGDLSRVFFNVNTPDDLAVAEGMLD